MRSGIFLAFMLFAFSTGCLAQSDSISKNKFHWGGATSDTSAGYAQAVLVDHVLYISGTVGMGTTMAEQIRSIYQGIERTLKNFGLSFQHVVKENLYTTDIEAVKQHNNIRKRFYNGDYPAATWYRSAGSTCQQRWWKLKLLPMWEGDRS